MQATREAVTAGNFDSRQLRQALGRHATGVAIVTARGAEQECIGLTVNSFNSVSLDPPLVLWSLANKSVHLRHFKGAAPHIEGCPVRLHFETVSVMEAGDHPILMGRVVDMQECGSAADSLLFNRGKFLASSRSAELNASD